VIRLHELRHTSASLALAAGVAMRVVSERLGHSTIGITQNLYTHVFDELSRDAAEKIADVIPRKRRKAT
jgi:integrase